MTSKNNSKNTSISTENLSPLKPDNSDQRQRDFLGTKKQDIQDVYAVYHSSVSQGLSKDATLSAISSFLSSSYGFTPSLAASASSRIYANFSSGVFQSSLIDDFVSNNAPTLASTEDDFDEDGEGALSKDEDEIDASQPRISISLEDYQKFVEFTQSDADLSIPAKRLLLSFIVFYRRNFHPSGWIRYDKKNIFYLAGVNRLSSSQQEKMTSYLHAHYGLNMRVVGSNQPTPCYNLSWLQDESPLGSTNNPLVNLGPLTPAGIASVVSKTK